MLDVTTTITINGPEGDRFLASLSGYDAPVPRALRWLAQSEYRSIEVDKTDADLVARFVDDVLGAGWISLAEPPLLYSPHVGDHVIVRGDVLAEIARDSAGLPLMWRFLPDGTRGKLLGWRDRDGDSRAVVDVHGAEKRLVVFIGEHRVTRAEPPVEYRPRPHRLRRAG